MTIMKVAVPRRTFLRGVGATLALPFLDAMVPAISGQSTLAAATKTRHGFLYVPMGHVLEHWIPDGVGANFDFKPLMKPLEPFRDQLTLVSNLTGFPDGAHAGASAIWMNGAVPKRTEAEDIRAGTTVDQVIAKKLGQDTRYPSLELAIEDVTSSVGSCESGYSCGYINTVCWATPTKPLPMEINPRVVFERMFGDAKNQEQRLAYAREDRSILDSVREEATRLKKGLGTRDAGRVSDYLDNVREIERRIQASEKQALSDVAIPEAPLGVPADYDEHVGLMFDLMALGFQANITRVSTFMIAREFSNRTYPQAGVPEPHHTISHHQNNPELLEKLAKINAHHLRLYSKFLETLRNTPDGDGSLLDHSMIMWGSGIADSNLHSHAPLWALFAGGANGAMKGNRHLRAPDQTPLGNLLMGIAAKAGAPVDSMGLSTGTLEI